MILGTLVCKFIVVRIIQILFIFPGRTGEGFKFKFFELILEFLLPCVESRNGGGVSIEGVFELVESGGGRLDFILS